MGKFVSAAPDAIRTRKAGVKVDRVIIHTAQGTLNGTVSWFAKAGRSVPTAAHYVIGETGEIVQMVPDESKAIHAGSPIEANWNDRSIGIEHAGWVDDGKPPSDAMLEASAKVTAVMCRKFGIPVDRKHIIGHVEVPHRPTDPFHTDPGKEWPWDRYMVLVQAEVAKLG
jgi:N-acetyl-anhydromuramyl-L-alanine amidase AmpD